MSKPEKEEVTIARARQAVAQARVYISKQPGATVVPLLTTLSEVCEGLIRTIQAVKGD